MAELDRQDGKDSLHGVTPSGSSVPLSSTPHAGLVKRQGANLPHWRVDGGTYAVTFRLADSLPAKVLDQWRCERAEIVQRAESMGRSLTDFETKRLDELHGERIEKWLDQGYGSCALRDPRIARLVADAIRCFDGQRYDLLAWCVMPNHAHAVLRTFPGRDVSKILQSWKGYTGKRAREILNTRGQGEFWQKEPYDHLIRDRTDLARQVRYVLGNPTAAGLIDWPWVGGSMQGQCVRGTAFPGGEGDGYHTISAPVNPECRTTGRKPGATA